jgi:hypothetical protein
MTRMTIATIARMTVQMMRRPNEQGMGAGGQWVYLLGKYIKDEASMALPEKTITLPTVLPVNRFIITEPLNRPSGLGHPMNTVNRPYT